MIYAGSLYDAQEAEHYFGLLLDAFEQLRSTSPEKIARCRFDLYITDNGTKTFERWVSERGLQEVIHFHAPMSPRKVLKEIAASDLVLAYHPHEKKDMMVTKFAEVAYLGCPILHIGDAGMVSQAIQEKRMGDSIRLEELVTELPRIIRGERTVNIDRHADQGEYLLGTVTDQLLRDVLV